MSLVTWKSKVVGSPSPSLAVPPIESREVAARADARSLVRIVGVFWKGTTRTIAGRFGARTVITPGGSLPELASPVYRSHLGCHDVSELARGEAQLGHSSQAGRVKDSAVLRGNYLRLEHLGGRRSRQVALSMWH